MIYCYETIESTQKSAKEHILSNKISQEITYFIAQEQTCGVGRQNKSWVSPKGNIYASIVIPRGYSVHDNILSLILAIVIDDVLNLGDYVKYKWPNDLLVNGAKIAGILIEKINDYSIIGVGINLVSSPVLEEYLTDNLQNLGLLNFEPIIENIIDLVLTIGDKILNFNNLSYQEIIDMWNKKGLNVIIDLN